MTQMQRRMSRMANALSTVAIGMALAVTAISVPAPGFDGQAWAQGGGGQGGGGGGGGQGGGGDGGGGGGGQGGDGGNRGENAGGQGGGQAGGQGGGQGGGRPADAGDDDGGDDDSDRPEWAGVPGGRDGAGGGPPDTAGETRGDLFGDLWVVLRDEDGIPVLTAEGYVQPLDADGNLIPLDEEGHPVDESLTVEVEMGRLNVGRAPDNVLARRTDEVVTVLNEATALATDPSGRLVITSPDGTVRTIDSPLENLAIYVALMTDGTVSGVTDLPGSEFDFMIDGERTVADMEAAASFLAAATDKTGAFTSDEIAYINAFVGVNVETTGDVHYSVVDYSGFSYDRSDAYAGVMTTVLVQQDDGSWLAEEVDVYDAVFGSVDAGGSGDLDAFTLAAEDARKVIEFIHEYDVPA